MKTILAIILLTSCSVAHAHDEESGLISSFKEMAAMHNAKIWGKINNDIARDAPPIKYQIENTYKVEAPAYPAPSAGSTGMDLQGLAKALANNPQVEKHPNSPFNNSYMPGVE
jgi:hypothetical protein